MHSHAHTDSSLWKQGRYYVHSSHGRGVLRFNWRFGGTSCRFTLSVGGVENGVTLGFALPFIGRFYVGFERTALSQYFPDEPRETGIRIFDWAVWIDLWNDDTWGAGNTVKWTDPSTWGKEGPYSDSGRKYPWSSMNWHPLRTLFGKMETWTKNERTKWARIPLPEGNYDAEVTLHTRVWKRPRLPWPSKQKPRAIVKPEKPIGVPGKGTAAYNTGKDAIYELTCTARTAEAAVAKVVDSVLNQREQYPK